MINFDPKNYRIHSSKNKKMIRKSLEECGAGRSIVVDADDTVIAGNGVLEQARGLGIPTKIVETSGALSVAFAQGGDFIGGAGNPYLNKRIIRKCMNTFFCSTERPFKFVGRINEDVNTYTTIASRGGLFMTVLDVMIVQKTTQSNRGGMTDVYIDKGTYLKSFYSVMMMPSAVKIATISGGKHRRIHHQVNWGNTVPLILSDRWRKTKGKQHAKEI